MPAALVGEEGQRAAFASPALSAAAAASPYAHGGNNTSSPYPSHADSPLSAPYGDVDTASLARALQRSYISRRLQERNPRSQHDSNPHSPKGGAMHTPAVHISSLSPAASKWKAALKPGILEGEAATDGVAPLPLSRASTLPFPLTATSSPSSAASTPASASTHASFGMRGMDSPAHTHSSTAACTPTAGGPLSGSAPCPPAIRLPAPATTHTDLAQAAAMSDRVQAGAMEPEESLYSPTQHRHTKSRRLSQAVFSLGAASDVTSSVASASHVDSLLDPSASLSTSSSGSSMHAGHMSPYVSSLSSSRTLPLPPHYPSSGSLSALPFPSASRQSSEEAHSPDEMEMSSAISATPTPLARSQPFRPKQARHSLPLHTSPFDHDFDLNAPPVPSVPPPTDSTFTCPMGYFSSAASSAAISSSSSSFVLPSSSVSAPSSTNGVRLRLRTIRSSARRMPNYTSVGGGGGDAAEWAAPMQSAAAAATLQGSPIDRLMEAEGEKEGEGNEQGEEQRHGSTKGREEGMRSSSPLPLLVQSATRMAQKRRRQHACNSLPHSLILHDHLAAPSAATSLPLSPSMPARSPLARVRVIQRYRSRGSSGGTASLASELHAAQEKANGSQTSSRPRPIPVAADRRTHAPLSNRCSPSLSPPAVSPLSPPSPLSAAAPDPLQILRRQATFWRREQESEEEEQQPNGTHTHQLSCAELPNFF